MPSIESIPQSQSRPPVQPTGGRAAFLRAALRATAHYSVPVAGVAAVLALRLLLEHWVRLEAPFLLFLMAVVGSAWYGGWGPGLTALGLAAVCSTFFFIEPTMQFAVATPSDWVQLGLFVVEALVSCGLCASLHAARARAEAEGARSRTLEGAVLEISDTEQRRIGQDLHDGLGQHLTGVAFLAKALERRVAADSPAAADDAARVAHLVSEAIGRARDVARGLSPVELERDGLRAALVHLTSGVAPMFGIGCELDWDPRVRTPGPTTALHLYRIAQEAIGNAVKHARPTRLIVRVTCGARGIGGELTVADDGTGIAKRRGQRRREGMGLQIMEYRARMIGGRLDVARPRRGPGTVVRCWFPSTPDGQPEE